MNVERIDSYVAQVRERLFGHARNLPDAVRLRLVAQEIRRHASRLGGRVPRVLDVGCGDKTALRHFGELDLEVDYCGLDPDPTVSPDLVGDARELEYQHARLPFRPDVILLLDVLEHLEGRHGDVRRVLRGCRSVLAPGGVVLISVPQMYRLDRLKLSRLHTPEHKLRLTVSEWRGLVELDFEVVAAQGAGYLSALPYLPMLHPGYGEKNALGQLVHALRHGLSAVEPLESADTWLSNSVGRVEQLKGWANDTLFVCRTP
ncbi:MAG TPA: class I SAM-dependent methyltransferase [Myxococcaceae bacterium]|nr:class I SAM-dependent methyltransferase [Myxococcaceae bacterium]